MHKIISYLLIKTGQNKVKYGDHFEIQDGRRRHARKKWKQLRFCLLEYKEGKNSIGSTSIANFALDNITQCTIYWKFGIGLHPKFE